MQPPADLPSQSHGFLTQPQQRAMVGGVMVLAQYDVARFSPALFGALGVTRPDTLARAVDKRLADYLAGRAMAIQAQRALGRKPQQITSTPDRAPIWPDGLAGSISHARGHCACLLLASGSATPGVDIERIATGDALRSILKVTLNDAERSIVNAQADMPRAATLCFSAKETLFKALYPTVGRFFGFGCAELRSPPTAQHITLTLTQQLHPTLPVGRAFTIEHSAVAGHVLTWMVHDTAAKDTRQP